MNNSLYDCISLVPFLYDFIIAINHYGTFHVVCEISNTSNKFRDGRSIDLLRTAHKETDWWDSWGGNSLLASTVFIVSREYILLKLSEIYIFAAINYVLTGTRCVLNAFAVQNPCIGRGMIKLTILYCERDRFNHTTFNTWILYCECFKKRNAFSPADNLSLWKYKSLINLEKYILWL